MKYYIGQELLMTGSYGTNNVTDGNIYVVIDIEYWGEKVDMLYVINDKGYRQGYFPERFSNNSIKKQTHLPAWI